MLFRKAAFFAGPFLVLFLFSILLGCIPQPAQNAVSNPFPTPTTSPRFSNPDGRDFVQTGNGGEQLPVPTKASLFAELALDEFSLAASRPTPAPEITQPAPVPAVQTIPIYEEGLSRNWMTQKSAGMEINLAGSDFVHTGDYSLVIDPGKGVNLLLFAVQRGASEEYRRQNVLGLSFWLNSGEETLRTDEMAVTVLGSNAYPYWVQGDQSVQNVVEPVFSETRLYHLGLNRSVPPDTWVNVELWLDERIYDPDYTYMTGFYIKSDASVQSPLYIDDIELITLEDTAENLPSPSAWDQLDVRAGEASGGLEPVWSVQVDVDQEVHPISPLIYGVTTADEEYLQALQIPLNSWGGNPSSRFNWKIGHAWNAGRDYFFRNGNYGVPSGSASDKFVEKSTGVGAEVRLSVPTLGWVAKNDDPNTCSFPLPNGECSDVPEAKCENPAIIADPNRANVPSTPEDIKAWMEHLFVEKGFDIRFIAMDNEPELWGYTHYDVHPECTTYQEILDKFLEYAQAVREAAPDVEILGPVTSGWYHYWNSAAGEADKRAHGGQDFLPWFLESVREQDEKNGERTLDVLDLHYYPQRVYNQEVDPDTSALRLRSTRSLWDPGYVDESWIGEAVSLIPRMKRLIDEYYPGTHLGISEWNWGAENSINGALAIADVLGIFGREDLYFASYYSFPPLDSPGFYAFKMYTNFDGQGSRFGDTSVRAHSTNSDVVSSFAAIDSASGNLHLMLINKQTETEIPLQVYIDGFSPQRTAGRYQYSQADLTSITQSVIEAPSSPFEILLPPYSITLIVLQPEGRDASEKPPASSAGE